MIKSAMRQALKETLMGMKSGLRGKRAKSHIKESVAEKEEDEEIVEAPKKAAVAEKGEDESWREDQKNFMKNKSKPSGVKTANIIGKPETSKKFGKANFAKKG